MLLSPLRPVAGGTLALPWNLLGEARNLLECGRASV